MQLKLIADSGGELKFSRSLGGVTEKIPKQNLPRPNSGFDIEMQTLGKQIVEGTRRL